MKKETKEKKHSRITIVAYVSHEIKEEVQKKAKDLGINESLYMNQLIRKDLKMKTLGQI